MKLSIKERLNFGAILPQKGNIVEQKLARDIGEKIEISQKEMKEIGLKAVGDTVQWNEKKAKDKNVEFTEMELDLLKKQVKELDEKKEITANILSLCLKINANA